MSWDDVSSDRMTSPRAVYELATPTNTSRVEIHVSLVIKLQDIDSIVTQHALLLYHSFIIILNMMYESDLESTRMHALRCSIPYQNADGFELFC
jgi:hypothetical protein